MSGRTLILGLLLVTVAACATTGEDQTSSSDASMSDSTPPSTTEPSTTCAARPTSMPRDVSTTWAPPSTTAPTSASTTRSDTRFCTEIGCNSALRIELSEVDITPNATYKLKICVDGVCTAETITIDIPIPGTNQITRGESPRQPGTVAGQILVWAEEDYAQYFLPDREYGESATVVFTLTDDDGSLLAQSEGVTAIPMSRSQPNGPGCPPICFHGRMTV